MNNGTLQLLLVAASIYFVTGLVMIVFAERIYNWAQQSTLPIITKGLFARAVISYYHLKTKGITGQESDLAYCLAFNGGVAISVTAIVFFGIVLIAIAVGLVAFFIFLSMLGSD
jgi:hypothetical protein